MATHSVVSFNLPVVVELNVINMWPDPLDDMLIVMRATCFEVKFFVF